MIAIERLKKSSSSAYKKQILLGMSSIELSVFYYAYSSELSFGIKDLNDSDYIGEPKAEMFTLLDDLNSRKYTGNEARNMVNEYISRNGSLIKYICNRDLDCGVAVGTINKIFPSYIPKFKLMLAKQAELSKLEFPITAQIKFDGVRIMAKVESSKNSCLLYTRNGKIVNFPELSKLLLKVKKDFVLDGELTNKSGKMEGRTGISGRVNSAIKGGFLTGYDVAYNVFDYLSMEEFNSKECNIKYSDRLVKLQDIFSQLEYNNMLFIADSFTIDNPEKANEMFNEVTEEGYEGLILKPKDHYYTFKRSKDWAKMKSIKTVELTCINTYSGKEGTKYEDYIGGLLCSGYAESVKVKVCVGTGLSDRDRTMPPENFVGKVIEVEYNAIMPSTIYSEGKTLFLPRFIAIRFDK